MINKHSDFILATMVISMFGTVCMETDIYVPAFPLMKLFFQISDYQIQGILSYNFIGICLGSLLFGPLSDVWGRQRVLRIGLLLFSLSSWGCVFLNNFDLFILCRFIQGFGAAAPMVASFAMLLDKYEPQRVAQLCGILNLFIAGAMAASPILGSILILYFSWKANFLIIALLASLNLLGSLFWIPETLSSDQRSTFSFSRILRDYSQMIKSFPYMAGNLICYLLFGSIMVFIANLSLIFIEHLGVSQKIYGFYQATIMGTFASISSIGAWMIGRYGTIKTKNIGLFLVGLGTLLLLLVTFSPTSPSIICSAMIVFTTGATLSSVIYGVEAVNVFPQLRGSATGLSNALRHLLIGGIIGASSFFFSGSISPVVWVIASLSAIIFFLVFRLKNHTTPEESPSLAV